MPTKSDSVTYARNEGTPPPARVAIDPTPGVVTDEETYNARLCQTSFSVARGPSEKRPMPSSGSVRLSRTT